MKRPDLPVYYYHDHFLEMLSFVRTTYGPILTDEHDTFVLRFQSLSKDAQCLLIRMVNRRGAIFNRTLFRYAEISDVERAAEDLLECGQARTLKAEDYAAFVACLPKDILITGAKVAGRTDIRVSWPKAKLVDYFLTHVPFDGAPIREIGRRYILHRQSQALEDRDFCVAAASRRARVREQVAELGDDVIGAEAMFLDPQHDVA